MLKLKHGSIALLMCLAISALTGCDQAAGPPPGSSQAAVAAAPLLERTAPRKGAFGLHRDDVRVPRLVIKLHEGTRVRVRGDKVVQISQDRTDRERGRMAQLSLTDAKVAADLASVERLVSAHARTLGIRRLFTAPEQVLADRKVEGERRSGEELADLDLYLEVPLRPGSTSGQVRALAAALDALPSVETAYAQPEAEPAQLSTGEVSPPATPDFQGEQGYLGAAPTGVDALYAWSVPGGSGTGVHIVDVEGAWRTTHEDLPPLFHAGGGQIADLGWRNHGTAVLGEMVGKPNGLGVTGIAHGAIPGVESIAAQSTASAVTNAALAAGPGGVVLVELHAPGPADSTPCTCNTGQCNYIAMEYWQDNYDAIHTATANGTSVVEAAGNGSANLDELVYGRAFDPGFRDSGAILVGAASAGGLVPMCWTNYGSRVNLHGWGELVVTAGYGDRYNGGSEDSSYTAGFSGTSSASPIVTASAASVQGALLAFARPALAPVQLRDLLVATGSAQASDARHIGPRPNLRAAIQSALASDGASLAWSREPPPFVVPGQIFKVKVTATNTGGTTWEGTGAANWYRLGASGGNRFTFTTYPTCGGYTNGVADARVYTCNTVSPGASTTYAWDVRAPWDTTSAKLGAMEVHDGVAWFGNKVTDVVGVGQAYCGKAVTQCILFQRPDILPFYAANGWDTSCGNRNAIINNWCQIDPTGCNELKTGLCAAFNNSTRCTLGLQVDGTPIDPATTFEGLKVCGRNHKVWQCLATGAPSWTATATDCL